MFSRRNFLSFLFLLQAFLFCSNSLAQSGPDPNYFEELKQNVLHGSDGSKPMGKLVSEYLKTEGASLEDKSLALALRKQEALPFLLQELDTGTPYGKRKITKFLRTARWNEAVPKLLEIAASNQEHEISRIAALHTLGSIGNKSVAHALVPLLEKENRGPTEKRVIIATLARLKYHPAVSSIEPFVNHANPLVRVFALRALAELGEPVDTSVIFALLESDDYVVRQEACGVLGVIGGSDTILKLRDIGQNDRHEAVRNAARIALHEIEASELKLSQRYVFYEQKASGPDKKISNWAIHKLAYESGKGGKALLHKLSGNNTSYGKKSSVYSILSADSYNQ